MNIWDSYFSEWVKGKRVALIGPGESTMGKKQGKFIDDHDIVARIRSFDYPDKWKEDLGTRTDILYTTSVDDRADTKNYTPKIHPHTGERLYRFETYNKSELKEKYKDIKIIVCSYPREEWFSDRYSGGFDFLKEQDVMCRFPRPEPYFKVKNLTNRPNSGFSAIIDLLSFELEELFITGLDFYRSLYRPDYQHSLVTQNIVQYWNTDNDGPDTHKPDLQFKYFKYKIYDIDKRVKVDEELEHYLSDKKYENIYE